MVKHKPSSLPVVGPHALNAVVSECPEMLLELWVGVDAITKHASLLTQAAAMGLAVKEVRTATLKQVDEAHRGIIGWCRPPKWQSFDWLCQEYDTGLFLVLDRVTDAHNFGACLRSAEAAGVRAVLTSERHAAGLSQGAAKSSSGALFRIPLVACSSLPLSVTTLGTLGWQTSALSERASHSLFARTPSTKEVVVVGNEHAGISPRVIAACQHKLAIPTHGANASLNVAVACGVAVLWLASTIRQST